MSTRTIYTVESDDGSVVARVRSKNQWGDYVVQFFVGGVHNQDADYFTDDRGDAESTAEAWLAGQVAGGVGADVVGAGNAAAAAG